METRACDVYRMSVCKLSYFLLEKIREDDLMLISLSEYYSEIKIFGFKEQQLNIIKLNEICKNNEDLCFKQREYFELNILG